LAGFQVPPLACFQVTIEVSARQLFPANEKFGPE